ncbi:hypothetical protein CUJ83_09095 [Methanocella sp. CWC-04]|uniref:Uncharacterized protein n=1 Tax=Methanooceanicella nereidis TaxID=2052831 RepID=A0AAP2W6D0_9EURY|nr:hypothetical protein [Methanocella sp. CWC-04]MCD1295152.1 hypothetical protein [Methanocella sp. CWC-04]
MSKLDKRVKRISRTDAFLNLSKVERQKFENAVEHAESLEQLPDRFRNIILSGERELQGY